MRAELNRKYSAAVVRVEHRGRAIFEGAYGRTRRENGRPIAVDTSFDLASITKVIVATVALAWVERGALALDATLLDTIPEWRGTPHASVTLRHLLAHAAGFASGADYRTLMGENVERFSLLRAPVAACGERVVYSDLGFIALGVVLERRLGRALRSLVRETLAPLAVDSLDYRPRAELRETIPASERDAWRGLVQGSVHDEKAHLMGGVSGHAGLFGNARDVARIADVYLRAARGWPVPIVAVESAGAVRLQADDPVLRRGLGWALKTSDENSCGPAMGPRTFGHTGFTGTCVWSDPDRDATIVLLTNAVHFGRGDIRELRVRVCTAAMQLVDARIAEARCLQSA